MWPGCGDQAHSRQDAPSQLAQSSSISSLLLFLLHCTVYMETGGTPWAQGSAQVLLTPGIMSECVNEIKSWITRAPAYTSVPPGMFSKDHVSVVSLQWPPPASVCLWQAWVRVWYQSSHSLLTTHRPANCETRCLRQEYDFTQKASWPEDGRLLYIN